MAPECYADIYHLSLWRYGVRSRSPHRSLRFVPLAGDNTLNYRGRYRYIEDLLEIDRRRPATQPRIPEGVGVVRTPLIVGKWEVGLAAHPDCEFSSYVIRGIRCVSASVLSTGRGQGLRCLRTCALPVSTPSLLTRMLEVSGVRVG